MKKTNPDSIGANNQEGWKEQFREKFELHDLGKDEFTICTNTGDGTCNGGVSVQAIEEKAANLLLDNLESFISHLLQQQREEVIREFKKKGGKYATSTANNK